MGCRTMFIPIIYYTPLTLEGSVAKRVECVYMCVSIRKNQRKYLIIKCIDAKGNVNILYVIICHLQLSKLLNPCMR